MSEKTAAALLEELKRKYKCYHLYGDCKLKQKYSYSSKEIDKFINCTHEFIMELTKPLLSVMSDNELKILKNVLVDSIPLPRINAHSIKASNNEYLVIINDKFMSLIYSWNELQYISILQAKTENDQKFFSKYFAPILDCYLTPTSGKTLPVFDFDELPLPFQMIAMSRTMLCEQFIIAHEFAHIYLGHCDGKNDLLNNDYKETYPAKNNQQQLEFDADVQAVKWLYILSKSEANNNPLQKSLMLFLDVFTILNLIECNTKFPSSSSSHPSAIARLINIKNSFDKKIFENSDYSIEQMIDNLSDIESFKIKYDPFIS